MWSTKKEKNTDRLNSIAQDLRYAKEGQENYSKEKNHKNKYKDRIKKEGHE